MVVAVVVVIGKGTGMQVVIAVVGAGLDVMSAEILLPLVLLLRCSKVMMVM